MIRIRSAAHTDIGRVRRRNEDRMIDDQELGLFGVADGVGGLPGGAEAAELALENIQAQLTAKPTKPNMVKFVREASHAVHALGQELSPATGIASTLSIGHLVGQTLHISHVGDSRCYALRGDIIEQLTTDHSVENEIRERRARGEDVHFHEINRNALTRCIGQPNKLEVDLYEYPLQPGDRILFCTDGITGLMEDEELANLLSEGREDEPLSVLKKIVALALQRGGHDNATAVLLYIDSTE
ncbi:MAG: serine/threonine protein phosphatase [Opitutaceae bacterium]|nr:serine/threonine protein phosphatase [Opitutaceae bacterium]